MDLMLNTGDSYAEIQLAYLLLLTMYPESLHN